MNTYIDSNTLPRQKQPGSGEFTEVVNNALCGANNVVATLRWLEASDTLDAGNQKAVHQMIYLMEGAATIRLNGQDHAVEAGGGVYLGPSEAAVVRHRGTGTLKLFHLVVPPV